LIKVPTVRETAPGKGKMRKKTEKSNSIEKRLQELGVTLLEYQCPDCGCSRINFYHEDEVVAPRIELFSMAGTFSPEDESIGRKWTGPIDCARCARRLENDAPDTDRAKWLREPSEEYTENE
jgi:uncharacterized Zn finger protein (UPF0148 family)